MKRGWKNRPLGEVIRLEYGKPLPEENRDDEGRYPAYGANGVLCRTNMFLFDKPSIIVGRKGSAGEVTITEDKFWPLDVTYFVIFDDNEYDLLFLYYCLKSLQLTRLAKGVKPGINRNDVYEIKFCFPSLPEQKRIVAILDEAFVGIDKAIGNTEKNLANTNNLFESYLNKIFSPSAGLEKGVLRKHWRNVKLKDICTKITDGVHKKPNYVEKGVPFLKINNLTSGPGISFEDVSYISNEDHELFCKRTNPERGDILITKDGTIGVVRIIDTEIEFSIFVSVALIKPIDKSITPYLKYVLESPLIQNQIKPQGAALKHLYLKDLREYSIPIAPELEQHEIVEKLRTLSIEVMRLKSIYQQKLDALTELKQSILQKAFAGELTAKPETVIKHGAVA